MIYRVFWTGFWFGMTVAAALFFVLAYLVFVADMSYLVYAGGFAILAIIEYVSYSNFVDDIRATLDRKPQENQDEDM